MRKWIAYMFLAIFSLQILPVKEIGKILFNGQITEEEVHGYSGPESDDNIKLKKEGDPLFPNSGFQNQARIASLSHKVTTAMHLADFLPDYHVPDILTPPPNC